MNTDDASSCRCLLDFFEELDDIALFQMDTQGRVTSWSPGVEAILGYSESEFVGRDVRELFTPEDRAQHADEAELERARVDGRSPDMRWHLKKGGGRIFVDGVIKGAFAADGTHIGYSKVMRDISRQRMEADMLRAILDGTPDAIYMKDCAGRFTFANSVAVRLLGRPIDEIIGYAVGGFLPSPHQRASSGKR